MSAQQSETRVRRRFKPYPVYRDSGVEWLGEIPAHWEVAPVYSRYHVALGKMLDAKRVTGQYPGRYLRNVDVQWDRVETEGLPEMDFAPSERERYGLRPGDLLVCEGGEVGRTAIWRGELEECFYQKAIHRVRPRSDREFPRFFYYIMYSLAKRGVFAAGGNPNTIDHLTAVQLRHYRFSFAPSSEQRAIAAFLDQETAKTDALVAKKERLIRLLQEKRTALITRAVTKGVDTNVPMKDSGVEWLGEIPKHWNVTRLRYACSLLRDGTHQPPPRVVDGYPLLSVRNIVDERLVRLSDDSMISDVDYRDLERSFVVKENDVLLAIVGATLGKVAIVEPMEPFAIQRSLAVLRPRAALILHDYLAFFLRSQPFQDLLWQSTSFSAQPGIYLSALASFQVALPPTSEQIEITEFLRDNTAAIEGLVGRIRDAIDRLKELRTALISAAVTGKIDVREEAT